MSVVADAKQPAGARLWIGPAGEIVDLDLVQSSHSLYVAEHAEVFGLSQEAMDRHRAQVNDVGLDCEFDYDTVIALAEASGWTRTSLDAGFGRVAISGPDPKSIRHALKILMSKGYPCSHVEVHLEWLAGNNIRSTFHYLEERSLRLFLRTAILPEARASEMPVTAMDLLQSDLGAAVVAPGF